MNNEANDERTFEIADYDLERFPEFKDESDALGMDLVQKQMTAVNEIIGRAFSAVFGKPIAIVKLKDIVRDSKVVPGVSEVLSYEGKPFIEFGEMSESFEERDGSQHMVIRQNYKVLA